MQHYSQQQRYGDNLRACRLMGLADVASKHSGVLLSHEKEGKAAIGNNMDGPWKQCAEWDKSGRKRQMLFDITYMWSPKMPDL